MYLHVHHITKPPTHGKDGERRLIIGIWRNDVGGTLSRVRTRERRRTYCMGNGHYPSIKYAQSTMLRVFNMKCITHYEIHLVGYSFVNDTDIVESDQDHEGPQATAV
jgi:hypothetical protein